MKKENNSSNRYNMFADERIISPYEYYRNVFCTDKCNLKKGDLEVIFDEINLPLIRLCTDKPISIKHINKELNMRYLSMLLAFADEYRSLYSDTRIVQLGEEAQQQFEKIVFELLFFAYKKGASDEEFLVMLDQNLKCILSIEKTVMGDINDIPNSAHVAERHIAMIAERNGCCDHGDAYNK